MKPFLIAIFFCLPLIGLSQEKVINDPLIEVRNVPVFTGIRASGGIELYLSQSNQPAVAVSAAESRFRDNIKTEVRDGILRIWYDDDKLGWLRGDKKLRAYISFDQLESLDVSGACGINLQNKLKLGSLSLKLSGACDIKGDVEVMNMNLELNGASDVKLSGSIENLKLDCSGASDIKSYDLVVQNCVAHISGASDVKITISNSVSASASGASSLKYKGNPGKKDVASSGASSISQRDD